MILSKESRKLIELRRNLLKLRRQKVTGNGELLRKILNKLSYDIKSSIKRDMDKYDNRRAMAILHENDPSKKWKLFKNFVNKGKTSNRIGDIIDLNGNRQSDDLSKSNAFAEKQKKFHSFPISPEFDETCRNDVTTSYKQLEPLFSPTFKEDNDVSENYLGFPKDDDMYDKITPNEVSEYLRKTKSKAAGGPDGVTYKHIKEGGQKLILLLCHLFNMILITGYYPSSWGKVNVKMLHKPGKAKLPVANYRPISLSNCLSKLFESCVKSRFEKKLSRIRIENQRQSAYKKNRGTQENCLKLTESVVNAFNVRGCVMGAFLDVSGAFDKVWKEGLIIKLARWGLGRRLTRVIANFLSSRSLIVKIANQASQIVYLLAGTPQGSVLSPILFNSFMDDLWELIPPGVELIQYADDICLYVSGQDPKTCERKLQESLNIVANWANVWRISMAPEKSNWILFTRCPSHKNIDLLLSMNSKPIPRCEKVKFLGILFDEKMTWKYYLDQLIRVATSKAVQIQSLSAKNSFNSPIQAIKFFNSVVKAIFDYGAVTYYTINPNQWSKIDKFHGRFLRSICGLPRCCSYEKLRLQLQQERLSIQIKDQAANRMAGLCKSSPFAEAWLRERGFCRTVKSFIKVTSNSPLTYQSPVELALDRHIMRNEGEILYAGAS